MKVAVLAYHSQNVNGSTYATNDHIALATDLSLIRQRGIPVLHGLEKGHHSVGRVPLEVSV